MDEQNGTRKRAEQQRRVASADENEMMLGTANKSFSKSVKRANVGTGRQRARTEMEMVYGLRLQPEDGHERQLAEMKQKWVLSESQSAQITFDCHVLAQFFDTIKRMKILESFPRNFEHSSAVTCL
jgi:hypothetical protein